MLNVYMLLDRSGSMQNKWEETLGAVNGYAAELGKTAGTKNSKITLAVFDGAGSTQFDVIRKNHKAKEWAKVTETEAHPRGMTPLFDAISLLDAVIKADDPEVATVVIITDGEENGSKEISRKAAGEIIAGFKEKLYDVVFIGADFDAFGQSHGLGIGTGNTLNASKGGIGGMAQTLASRSAGYTAMHVDGSLDAATLSVMQFSEADRRSVV